MAEMHMIPKSITREATEEAEAETRTSTTAAEIETGVETSIENEKGVHLHEIPSTEMTRDMKQEEETIITKPRRSQVKLSS